MSMNELPPKKSSVRTIVGPTGNLSIIESLKDISFDIKRIFYISNVPKESKRGFHAHRHTKQFLICLKGSCEVYLEFKGKSETIILKENAEGIFIQNEWHIMKNFSDDCILLVLANSIYDEKDYIRNYEEFLKYSNEK